MRSKCFIFLVFVLLITSYVCGGPIIGSSANTIKSKSFMFESHISYTPYSARYYTDGEEWIGFSEDESNVVIGFLPQLYYGVFDFLTIRLTAPVNMHKIDYGVSEKSTGIGDIIIDFKHRLLNGKLFIPTVSWFGGIRLPTGNKKASPALGDGSTDAVVGILVTEHILKLSSHSKVGYWLNGKVDDVDIPNMFFYNEALEYGLPLKFAFVTELNGFISGSGNEQRYCMEFCPGINNKLFPNLVLEASVKIPIWARLGLRYDYSPFVGFMYLF